MATDYKSSRVPVRFQNRTAYDPSDRLFAESKDQALKDQSMIKDMEKVSKDYGQALDVWDKNLAALDKEKVDFINTISTTLSETLGTTVPQLMKLQAEKTDEQTLERFRNESVETQQLIRDGNREVWARKLELDNEKLSLEEIAKNLNTPGGQAYYNFLQKGNKRSDTSIFRHLMQNHLDLFGDHLSKQLTKTEPIYKNGDQTFSGVQAANDKDLLLLLVEQEKAKFYKRIQVGGLNTKVLVSYAEEPLSTASNTFLNSQGLKIDISNAKKDIHNISNSVQDYFGSTQVTVDGDNYAWKSTDGTIPADTEVFLQNILTQLEIKARTAGFDSPLEVARDQFSGGLRLWAGDDPDKIRFVDEILGVYGSDHKNALKLIQRGTDGKEITFSELDSYRYGGNGVTGAWTGVGKDKDTGFFASGLGGEADARLLDSGHWTPIIDGKAVDEQWIKDNPLIQDGVLNPLWQGTFQYKLTEAYLRGDTQAEIDAIKSEAVKAFDSVSAGQINIKKIYEWEPPIGEDATIKSINKANDEGLFIGGEIPESFFDGKYLSNKVREKIKEMGLTVVKDDERIGSNGEDLIAENKVIQAIFEYSKGNYNANHENIKDEIIENAANAYKKFKGTPNEITFSQAVDDQIAKFKAIQGDDGLTTDKWRINSKGEVTNPKYRFINPWDSGRQEDVNDAERILQNKLNTNNNIDANKAVSTQVEVFSVAELNQAAEEFTKKGTLPLWMLKRAANNNENVVNMIKNQLDYHKLSIPGLDPEVLDQITESYTGGIYQMFKPQDLAELYKLIGNKNPNDIDIASARIINQKVNEALKRDGGFWRALGFDQSQIGTKLPNQQSILSVIETINKEQGFTSKSQTTKNGVVYYGIYQLTIEQAKSALGDNYPGDKAFIENEGGTIQRQAMIALIDDVTMTAFSNAVNETDISLTDTDINRFTANVVRNIFHSVTNNGEDLGLQTRATSTDSMYSVGQNEYLSIDYQGRKDTVGVDVMNQNTLYLLRYLNNNTGGRILPSAKGAFEDL